MDTFWQDVKYGARMLAKSPGFTLVAVLTLALGIGANTAIFSVINGYLLRPLPYDQGENIVFLSEWSEQVPNMSFSVENFKDLRDQSTVFEAIAAFRGQNYVLTGSDQPERVSGREVSVGMFDALRLKPVIGRVFTAEEDKVGAERVVLLNEGFWRRRFAADPNVLNQQLVLNGESFTVVGVLAGNMHQSMRNTEVFTSLMRREDQLGGANNRGNHPGIYIYARRKAGVSEEQARTEVVSIAQRLAEQYPNSNARQSMTVTGLKEALVEDDRPALLVLMGAVGFVLLIACANVANLLLGRAAARQREIAVRTALGAGRGRVVRQMLTESLLLAIIGGFFGVGIAFWGLDTLLASLPENAPQAQGVSIDGTVLGFTAVVALLTGLLFGVVPAWQASRADVHETLKEGGRGSSLGVGHHRMRSALVVVETALALILLVGTGLMLKSFFRVLQADAGFDERGVLTGSVSGPDTKYKEAPERRAFIEQVVARVQAIPGVQYAASALPLLGGWQSGFSVEGRPEPPPGQRPSADITRISPDYFRAMGIRLLQGRMFSEQDHADAPKVCMVDERFAQTHWPNENPIGKRVKFGGQDSDNPWIEVVGVVNHVKHYGVDQDSRVEMYLPYTQSPIPSFTLIIRTQGDPASLTSAVRQAVQSVDPDVPIYQARTLEDIMSERVAQRRLAAVLISVFGGLALVLAAVGIYGVMNYAVTQRTHEMGIRMALGAQQRDILSLVVRQGMLLAVLGLVIGFAVSFFGLSRVMTTVLFQVSATDPPTYSLTPFLLAVVALLACYLPARRATRVDPMVALRYE